MALWRRDDARRRVDDGLIHHSDAGPRQLERDCGTESSDVDLLYVLAPDSTLGFEIVDLRDELEMIVSRRVDLVPKSRLKWVIRDRVLAEARVLYAA
ncbi:hypothetical protein FF36_05231 [Frankia torreyi]|uniref:Polymerase nucleotidyl transferase domain-containing protein n=1 Tax=Frankia torreyi TaxID=1856 RepID=A0A0D8B870_9ACTN|nr:MULTISPECIES: nucleotidyltransferase domain-containing protein [Frankia]KJE20478.1 hypothetical protein FF36_05231 [Frankia torreyi]KQM02965.1 hypothetical protein FF86_105118 [Frankia sp. CpI1-P]